jgi:tetratricopeptide (TPR) repeat protein
LIACARAAEPAPATAARSLTPPAAPSPTTSSRATEIGGSTNAAPALTDPLEQEFQKLLKLDDEAHEAAQAIVDQAAASPDPLTAPLPLTTRGRIDQRLKPVREAYEEFLNHHPGHARARMAFASFLNDTGNEAEATEHYEKARALNPTDPAVWNNLANIFAHSGPIEKAFPYYEEAIRLNPKESLYQHNFGTLIFLFRKDAARYFKCDEPAVFARALDLYARALALDPQNFQLASDVAQTFYGIPPTPGKAPEEARAEEIRLVDTALKSWTNAFSLASEHSEQEGILLHFARWNIRAGQFDAARTNLSGVTNVAYLQVKQRLERNLAEKQSPPAKPVEVKQ